MFHMKFLMAGNVIFVKKQQACSKKLGNKWQQDNRQKVSKSLILQGFQQ